MIGQRDVDDRDRAVVLAHELVVAARKFGNLMPFGCWWFLNNPSVVEEITRERLRGRIATFVHLAQAIGPDMAALMRRAGRVVGTCGNRSMFRGRSAMSCMDRAIFRTLKISKLHPP